MFAHRTATGLAVALLALPAGATATAFAKLSAGNEFDSQAPYDNWGGDPHPQTAAPATPRTFASPDAADAARAGEIARAMEHYQRSQPAPAAAKPASPTGDTTAWPEIAFAGVVVLATAGGLVRVQLRRGRRVAA